MKWGEQTSSSARSFQGDVEISQSAVLTKQRNASPFQVPQPSVGIVERHGGGDRSDGVSARQSPGKQPSPAQAAPRLSGAGSPDSTMYMRRRVLDGLDGSGGGGRGGAIVVDMRAGGFVNLLRSTHVPIDAHHHSDFSNAGIPQFGSGAPGAVNVPRPDVSSVNR